MGCNRLGDYELLNVRLGKVRVKEVKLDYIRLGEVYEYVGYR